MPLYQYHCASCDETLERRQSFDDAPLAVCPGCGGGLRRIFHPVGIIFKGSGWYCTDSRPQSNSTESSPKAAEATSAV